MKHTKASTWLEVHLGTWMRLSLDMTRPRFSFFYRRACERSFCCTVIWQIISQYAHPSVFYFFYNEPKKRALCEVTVIPGQIKGGGCWSLGRTPAVRCTATRTPANGRRGPKVSKVTSAVQRVVYPVAVVGARGIFQPWELQAESVSHLVHMVQHLRTETKKPWGKPLPTRSREW